MKQRALELSSDWGAQGTTHSNSSLDSPMRPRCVWARRAALSHGNQYRLVIKQKGVGQGRGGGNNNPLWKVGYVEKCRAVQIVALPRTKYAISECVGAEREEHCQTLAHFSV